MSEGVVGFLNKHYVALCRIWADAHHAMFSKAGSFPRDGARRVALSLLFLPNSSTARELRPPVGRYCVERCLRKRELRVRL